MKESLASPFAHLPFVQAAVSAKNHSQASPERRGGRVKDSREDELPLRTWQQANTNRREEEFPPLDNLDLFCRRTKRSFCRYAPGKQRHWTSRTFPVFLSSSSVSFSSLSPPRMSVLVWRHDQLCQLCTLSRELFHSVPAIMKHFTPSLSPRINMTVEELET